MKKTSEQDFFDCHLKILSKKSEKIDPQGGGSPLRGGGRKNTKKRKKRVENWVK